ncbi:hypothetical protein QP027_08825 [Corynebacterium breve]|uniref:Uncharacterized protein n=1 Tax=Corynebacterium breve TaxID=3049799 RepID=A0ABY8VG19_9CORY|nr:hypothetical protein [Corynebacterium breve]WIM67218.1 hypothetical protein QP027_08825 [Corynebacterium breve]
MDVQFSGIGKIIQYTPGTIGYRVEGNFKVMADGQVWVTDKKGKTHLIHPAAGPVEFILS